MSSRDKTSSASSSKARHKDKTPNTNARVSKAADQSTSGSRKANNQRRATTNTTTDTNLNKTTADNGSRSGSSTSNSGSGADSTRAFRSSSSSKRGSSGKQESRIESELVTTTSNLEELKSSSDAMSKTKILETNIDCGGGGGSGSGHNDIRRGSSSDKEESDESSCLLSSESQSDTPVKQQQQHPGKQNREAVTTTNGSSTSTENDLNKNISDNPEVVLPSGWEQHSDKLGLYYWHVSTGVIQRNKPQGAELHPNRKESVLVCHDDEEINQVTLKTSDSDDDDYYESGAALTLDDTSETTFVVYPLGCCEFDETQLVSASSTKTIQKCILRLCNMPTAEESVCWGLDQSQPILMKLHSDHIQFTDLKTRNLLRSQPINTIKTWAVDDDNNFAFVIEDRAHQSSPSSDPYESSVDYALLSEPRMMCYVFRSMDDDDMSCKVAAKLNEEISRYKEQLTIRMAKSTHLQQMIEPTSANDATIDQLTDAEEDFECLETSNELTLPIKYIGSTPVPRPTGIDVLNIAIDKCLAEASNKTMQERGSGSNTPPDVTTKQETDLNSRELRSALIDARLHVSPSSVIVENHSSGEIIVECRIRYLTFMGISRRDIRWCGFIMQNSTNKAFIAHCFECHPTAGPVCDAIQQSCTKMYEKVVKISRRPPETRSIIPSKSRIRNTLAKTFARIKLNPITN